MIGLRMLAARELSTTGLTDRLRRRGLDVADIDTAIARLRRVGALDDERAARAFARTFQRRGRGAVRVLRDVEGQGVEHDLAQRVVAELFDTIDEATVIDEILNRRLDGPVRDRAHRDRLLRQLVRRGFSIDVARRALERRRGSDGVEAD